jgi:hypothetical protein
MSRYLAIVPAFNEAGSIARTVTEIREHAPAFDVLVIDDGSSDGTAALAAGAGARVVSLPFNVGIGGAMQCGYLYARDNGYAVAVQVDGDGQHDPRDIDRLLEALTGDPELEMVTGSRFLERGDGYRSTRSRMVGIRVFAGLMSAITRQRVTDPTSGFRMSGGRAIELFARDYPPDYPEVEAILLLHAHRLRMREVPVAMRPRTTGRSKIVRSVPAYYMVKVLLAVLIGLLRARGRRPPMTAAAKTVAGVSPTLTRAIVIAIAVLAALIVLELVRRRRMMERYALLWLAAAATLLVLAIWKGLLTTLSADVGIKAPANALFAVGFLFLVVLLLSVSLVISRLSDQNKQLAQRVALLSDRIAKLEREDDPGP